jgi:hypothetical protein
MRLQLAPISVLEFAQIALDAGGRSLIFNVEHSQSKFFVEKSLAVFSPCFPDLELRQAKNLPRIPLSAKWTSQ